MDPKKTVLIIEDDPALRLALTEKLTDSGFAVLEAGDGKEGITIALAKKPDLILLDLLMPKMDGPTTMHHIRQDAWGKHVPFIIFTNFDADDKILRKVGDNQPSFYLIKAETSLDEIVSKIKDVLQITDSPVV